MALGFCTAKSRRFDGKHQPRKAEGSLQNDLSDVSSSDDSSSGSSGSSGSSSSGSNMQRHARANCFTERICACTPRRSRRAERVHGRGGNSFLVRPPFFKSAVKPKDNQAAQLEDKETSDK